MPARSPFTQLCRAAVAPPRGDRADLHMHSTASDGQYTPGQLVDLAVRCGLAAIAVTDHDTLSGSVAAAAAAPPDLEVVAAVEISCEQAGREVHLLAYFIDVKNVALNAALQRLRAHRTGRYAEMTAKLHRMGVALLDQSPPPGTTLGRRHLAEALVAAHRVGSIREAFQRYLDDGGPADVPKMRLKLPEAIGLIRQAGGIGSLAHPRSHVDGALLAKFAAMGLGAVEAVYPGFKAGRTNQLRKWAAELRLGITGGSDCHGPEEPRHALGAKTISLDELNQLRSLRELSRC